MSSGTHPGSCVVGNVMLYSIHHWKELRTCVNLSLWKCCSAKIYIVSMPTIQQRALIKETNIWLSLVWISSTTGGTAHRFSFRLINGWVEIEFFFAKVYCMSSQMSGDYTSWVQLPCFILCGCEHCHNSIKTGLLGLYDPAPLKKRRQSLTNWFGATYARFAFLFAKEASGPFSMFFNTVTGNCVTDEVLQGFETKTWTL